MPPILVLTAHCQELSLMQTQAEAVEEKLHVAQGHNGNQPTQCLPYRAALQMHCGQRYRCTAGSATDALRTALQMHCGQRYRCTAGSATDAQRTALRGVGAHPWRMFSLLLGAAR